MRDIKYSSISQTFDRHASVLFSQCFVTACFFRFQKLRSYFECFTHNPSPCAGQISEQRVLIGKFVRQQDNYLDVVSNELRGPFSVNVFSTGTNMTHHLIKRPICTETTFPHGQTYRRNQKDCPFCVLVSVLTLSTKRANHGNLRKR